MQAIFKQTTKLTGNYSFCTYMCLQHTVRLLVLYIHVLTAYSETTRSVHTCAYSIQ